MSEDELANLRARYETAGEGYGHFKLTLLEKIENYFAPYEEKRAKLLENPKEVRDILEFGASKARKIASEKMRKIRDTVGLI